MNEFCTIISVFPIALTPNYFLVSRIGPFFFRAKSKSIIAVIYDEVLTSHAIELL